MAAPVDAGSIYSDVRISLDKLTADITSVKTGFSKLSTDLQTSSGQTKTKVSSNFEDIGLSAVAAVVLITASFKKAITVFASTEQQLANVKAVSNSTAEEFAILEAAAESAGETTRFTASQAADALFYLASAGLSATESVSALDGVLLLAGATGSDLASTAQTITATLAQFDIATENSADVANVFAAANSNSQATMEKLSNALTQVGPVAAGLNISLEETVAALQLLFNAGFKGETAGRALKSALADLANESSSSVGKLKSLGIAFEDVDPTVVGLTGAIKTLEESGITTAQTIDVFGKVAGPQLATLIKEGSDALVDYEEAVTGTNEAARQYAVQNDTLSGSVDRLKSAVESSSNSFIGTLAPILSSVAKLFANILVLLNKLPSGLKALASGATGAAVGFLSLRTALALIGITLSTGPLGLITLVGSLGVGLVSLVSHMQDVKKEKLSEEFGDVAESIGLVGSAIDEFTDKAGKVEGLLNNFTTGIDRSIEGTAQKILEIATASGLSVEAVIEIGKASDDVTEAYKKQLDAASSIATELEAQAKIEAEKLQIEKDILSGKTARLEKEKEAKLLAEEQLRIQQEIEAVEKAKEDAAERALSINNQAVAIDKLIAAGIITQMDGIERKKELREEEIAILEKQMITSGEVTDEALAGIEKQKASVKVYETVLADLNNKEEEIASEREERDAKVLSDAQARADLIETLTLSALDVLKNTYEENYALLDGNSEAQVALTEKYEKEKTAIVVANEEKKTSIINEGIENELEARKELKEKQMSLLSEVGSYYEQALSLIDTATTGSLDSLVDGIADTVMQIGEQTGSVEVLAAGLALKMIKSVSDTFTDDGAEDWEKVLVGVLTVVGGVAAGALASAILSGVRDSNEAIEELTTELENELSEIILEQRQETIENDYDNQIAAIDKKYASEISSVKATLTKEELLRLQSLGVIEETTAESNESSRQEALDSFQELMEDQVDANAEAQDEMLNETLNSIEAAYEAETERINATTEAEQALIDFKANLTAEEEASELAASLATIAELRAAGEDAAADELQLELDNAAKLELLEEAAALAEAKRIEDLAALEAQAALDKQDARDAELLRIEEASAAEIQAINDVYDAQALSDKATADAETAYNNLIAQYDYDKAVYDRDIAIAAAKVNKEVAVSEVPWYKSGIFGNTDDKVEAMYDSIISQLQSTPLPAMPAFATGGIVLQEQGLSSTGDQHQVRVNPGEMILNADQQKSLFDIANGSSGGSSGGVVNIKLYMDQKQVAKGSARYYNNGIVKLELK